MTDTDIYTMTTGTLTAAQVMEEKDTWAARETQSEGQWESMDQEKREAVKEIVVRSLERALDRIDDWLPYAMDLSVEGQYVDINHRIGFSNLETEQKARHELTQRQIQRAALGTIEMARDDG